MDTAIATRAAERVYTMLYRPATQYGTLPPGVQFTGWVRVPRELAARFRHLSVSNFRFGEFTVNRALTETELKDYQIERVR